MGDGETEQISERQIPVSPGDLESIEIKRKLGELEIGVGKLIAADFRILDKTSIEVDNQRNARAFRLGQFLERFPPLKYPGLYSGVAELDKRIEDLRRRGYLS